MKRILFTIFFLLWCGSALGETYYVSSGGNDLSAGTTAETAWATLERASQHVFAAGDIVYLTGSATVPLRGTFALSEDATGWNAGEFIDVKPVTGSSYLMGSYDVSHGHTYVITNDNGNNRNRWLQTWTSATDAVTWTEIPSGTSTINREGEDHLIGTYCMRFDQDASNSMSYARLTGVVLPAEQVQLYLIYKTTATGEILVDVQDSTTKKYVQADSTFGAAIYRPILPSTAIWSKLLAVPAFTPETNGGTYRVQVFGSGASQSVYLQAITITVTNTWKNSSGDIYYINFATVQDNVRMLKSTGADWAASGAEALEVVPSSVDLASITAGKSFYDSSAKRLYYQIAEGENIETMHFEALQNSNTMSITGDYYKISDLNIHSGYLANIRNIGAIATYTDIDTAFGNKYGAVDSSSSVVDYLRVRAHHNNPTAAENDANGFLCDASTTTWTRCMADNNGDDGFQVDGGGTITIANSVAHSNLSEQLVISDGAAIVYNNTFYDGTPPGYDDGDGVYTVHDKEASGQARVYRNNIIVKIRTGMSKAFSLSNATGLTESNNLWFGGTADTYGATSGLNVDPSLDADFNSPLYAVGRGGLFIAGFHDAAGMRDFDGTYIPHYRIPIGAQAWTKAGLSKWGVWK